MATARVIVAALAWCASAALARDVHVSPAGSDAGDGSAGRPLRTIQKAADLMQPGDTCYLREGVYRQGVRPARSGEPGRPIRFAALPGEDVVLSGTEPIRAKWTVHAGRIWKARVERDVSQLFVDGEMMVEARWPNQPLARRWDKATWRPSGKGSDYGRIVDAELGATGIDWTGAAAVLNVGAWQTFLRPVRSHGAGKDAFEYARDLGKRHESPRTRRKRQQAGFDRYFLFGKLEALDAPGEWHFDRGSRTLYLWPPGGTDPSARRVEGKRREYAFRAEGTDHVELRGLRFFAATVALENCDHCVIDGCQLLYPTYAAWADRLDGTRTYVPGQRSRKANRQFLTDAWRLAVTLITGRGNTVRNCHVAFSEGPGLMLAGSENTIENCLIHDIDWRGLGNAAAGNCGAVYMAVSARSVLRRNTVFNVGSSEGLILPTVGPSVCEYNYVHHGGLIQSDGSLIQSNGIRLNGTQIRYNWVHDHLAFQWGGIGIRGDDLTRDLIVHHNVVWRCREKGIIVKGDRNRVHNNSCFDNPRLDLVLWAAAEPFKEWVPQQWDHLLKKQNAHSKACNNYAPVLTGQMPYEVRRDRALKPPAAELSHNFRPTRAMLIDPKGPTFRDDGPLLADPARLDFRPRAGSPLIDAGRVIEGITDGFAGKAPDVGAYEHAADRWVPGYRNRLWLLPPRAPSRQPRLRLVLPPLGPIAVDLSAGHVRRRLTFTPDNWMRPQPIALGTPPPEAFRCVISDLGLDGTFRLAEARSIWGRRRPFRTIP